MGANTEAERNHKKALAEAAIIAVRAAWVDGVVAGGGVAYLDCVPAITALPLRGDTQLGAQAVMKALEAPLATIVQNAGFTPRPLWPKPAPSIKARFLM